LAITEVDLAPSAIVCAERETTPENTEGPYYMTGSPERTSLVEPDMSGDRLGVVGTVLFQDCVPVAGAWLDFWQADAAGQYDNDGYRLRGHQFSDEAGRYRLDTVLPAAYGGRPRHIHVKVQPPGGPILTTQLYFPQDPLAAGDAFFDPALTVVLEQVSDGYQATFDFVLDLPAP
jgi:protocatechuate 3,4-dioxygenase beta subunit